MAVKFIQELKNVQHLLSQALEIIPSNQRDQYNVPPLTPLFTPVDNATICANDNVQL